MITKAQYFGNKSYPVEHGRNADILLGRVNGFLYEAAANGVYGYWIDPDTDTQISGAKGGSGDGGYRTQDSTTGASKSRHKYGKAVDVFDPDRILAKWILGNIDALVKAELWCEDFQWTPGWCHFQSEPPGSGSRIYIPSSKPAPAPW